MALKIILVISAAIMCALVLIQDGPLNSGLTAVTGKSLSLFRQNKSRGFEKTFHIITHIAMIAFLTIVTITFLIQG